MWRCSVFKICLLDCQNCVFQRLWSQSCWQQDWMFLVVWGDKKYWCVACEEIAFISRVFYLFYIIETAWLWETVNERPFFMRGLKLYFSVMTSGMNRSGIQHIHGRFCCWRVLLDKSLINRYKLNEHRLCKWRCW